MADILINAQAAHGERGSMLKLFPTHEAAV